MIPRVGSVFSLRRHEIGPASLLFCYLFLVIGAYLMGQSVGDALFLSAFPGHLPYAMIGSALVVAMLVAAYIRLSVHLRLGSLIAAVLGFFSISFTAFWWLASFQLPWVYWLIYLWVYGAGAIGPMMGWTLANYVLTAREARRIFGFVGAGAILGGTFFSFAAADLLHQRHVRPQSLLLAVALLHLLCVPIVQALSRSAAQRAPLLAGAPAAGRGIPSGFASSLRMVHGSRYLVLLAALVTVGCFATCILGYQFKLIARAAYGTNTEQLAAFFSRFNGYMGLASFVFQMALTGPLLRMFGIRVTLLVIPVALMGSSLAVLISPTLISGCLLRGSHCLLRYSLDKSSTELMYVPVAPEVRSQVKSFIDTFVWRTADGLAGLVLLFFANVVRLSPGEMSAVNLVALSGWIAIALRVRNEYLSVLRKAIERHTLDPERTAARVLDSSTTEILSEALGRGGEQELMYGMSLFELGHHAVSHPALRRLLDHRSPAVRLRALRLLNDAGDREAAAQVERLVADENLEVRAEALHFLAVHAGKDPLALLGDGGRLPAHTLQGAVAVYLHKNGGEEYSKAAGLILEGMLASRGPEGAPSRREAARVLGVIPQSGASSRRLSELLGDDDPEVVHEALLSVATSRQPEFLVPVIVKLGDRRCAAAAGAALASFGEAAAGTLIAALNDGSIPVSSRKRIPEIMARTPTLETASALARSLIQGDPELRFRILKALNKLRDMDPALVPWNAACEDLLNAELIGYCRSLQILAALDIPAAGAAADGAAPGSLRLLKRALQERMNRERERVFRLLSLLYPPRDVYNAYKGLTSGRVQLEAHGLEVLEHVLPQGFFRRMADVIDPEGGKLRRLSAAREWCRVGVDCRGEALRILMHSEDEWLRVCALYAAGSLREAALLPEIIRCPCDGGGLLADTRDWAASLLAAGASA